MNYHILPIIERINGEHIYDGNFLSLEDAILSDPFKNGLIDHFLKPNDYMLTVKDIAIAINMGVHGHSNTTFLKDPVIDAAFYLAKELKERILLDDNLKYVINVLGKNISELDCRANREEIENIFSDKKKLFKEYFNLFNSAEYAEKITVYYPGYGKSWIEWNEDESLEVPAFKHDIPRGFFLMGFDYKFGGNWLRSVIRTKDKEYFNSSEKNKGNVVWLN